MEIHFVYHKFCDYMKRWYYTKRKSHSFKSKNGKLELVETKREFKEIDFEKMLGYKASCRVERYSSKNPDIKIASCDDNTFMSSKIVLIPHKAENHFMGFMGITMILIPQCKHPSNVVFLYPNHIVSLLKAFKEINNDLPINVKELEKWQIDI